MPVNIAVESHATVTHDRAGPVVQVDRGGFLERLPSIIDPRVIHRRANRLGIPAGIVAQNEHGEIDGTLDPHTTRAVVPIRPSEKFGMIGVVQVHGRVIRENEFDEPE